jgi:hypothetical protein
LSARPASLVLIVGCALAAALGLAREPALAAMPDPPTREECAATKAATHLPPIVSRAPAPDAPRVFAMQFKQEVANVTTYDTFRTKIECMIRQYARGRFAKGRPNLVAFNEDVGLMTIATGSRGEAAREIVADPESSPTCGGSAPAPCAALGALVVTGAAYSQPMTAYRAMFPDMGALESQFIAPTDTFARGWMQTFSDMARRYDIYIAGSNTQAPFRESTDPAEIEIFRDPDLPPPESVFIATDDVVYNEAFLWGPETVDPKAPEPLRNVVASNRKVPLTDLEIQLEISAGASTGPEAIENLRPFRLPGTKAKLGFATSLPAFKFGHEIGTPAPDVDPCSDTALYYMRCLDQLGTNVVIQDEANPGPWAALGGQGAWQPLEWMGSTWRHVADRSVGFDYNVTPFMVGNLADLPFDGQTAITQRARTSGRRCTFIGDRRFRPDPPENDPAQFEPYAGLKRRFLAIAPWVIRSGDRDRLRATSQKLATGSGDPRENDYVETAVIADLPFPVERNRPGCLRAG